MSVDRRNPYVILGIPYGASGDEARAGFARASRLLKATQDVPYSIEDLTWALHQVEQILEEPDLAFHVYRVPADPGALGGDAPGLFNPPPHRLPRKTEPAPTDEMAHIRRLAARSALLRHVAEGELRFDLPAPYDSEGAKP